ncbi:helix-hairpin-helix domain-containing protein [Myxococcota bacterium]|nr:helix-hairpin-helix domain-containing protein [Myxococcota bacterium]
MRQMSRAGSWGRPGVLGLLMCVGAAVAAEVHTPRLTAPSAVVEVTGDVPHPGLYELTTPTLHQAVAAAGLSVRLDVPDGPLEHGDAVIVTDGVPVEVAPVSAGALALGQPLDLNRATALELEALPKVGPALAGRIVALREARGGFKSVKELDDVKGVGPATLKQLTPLVTVRP